MSRSNRPCAAVAVLVGLASCAARGAELPELPELVAAAEEQRIATIERISRSTVAIFEASADNGGSGVIIDRSGLIVTNHHVAAPCGASMLVGTSDGRVHPAVLIGLDPTGDIALVQMVRGGPFHAAQLGDSDRVAVGDAALVAGNPFLLAEDFTPTLTAGVISGVARYQHPAGGILEYADCLQTDAAINPGNSGGPLFDGAGRLIGINGRGSFEKRGRVNVGVGYAVSINQVKRFVSHLRTGRIVDHASLGATVVSRNGPQAIVSAIETDSDAYRRGIRPGDEIVAIDGRDTSSANAVLNAIGVAPAGWRVRVVCRRDAQTFTRDVRLGPLHSPGELQEVVEQELAKRDAGAPSDQYEYKAGYANFAATRAETDRLLQQCADQIEIPFREGGEYLDRVREEAVVIALRGNEARWRAKSGEFVCRADRDLAGQAAPPGAPSLLGGLWVLSRLLRGESEALDRVEAFGALPWEALGSPHDVLEATHRGLTISIYFDREEGRVIGFEASRDDAEEPVRVAFDAPQEPSVGGKQRIAVTIGDRLFADLRVPDEEHAP